MPTALQWKAMGDMVAQGRAALPPGALRAVRIAGVAGIVLATAEETRLRRFVPPAVAVGLGALLPLGYSLTIAAGAAVAAVCTRLWRLRPEIAGVVAAGLIAGDSVVGIAIALLKSFGKL
jgi:uncharacterized oligopeptide transporter (OPT) family protein